MDKAASRIRLRKPNAYLGRSETFCRGFQTSIYRRDRNEHKGALRALGFEYQCFHKHLI